MSYVRTWPIDDPARLVVLVHGYGEHIGRYEHVAAALNARGSAVVGPDHRGHGESRGERALVEDFEPIVDDLRAVVAGRAWRPLPVVMVGHSMGGLIATRYAQRSRRRARRAGAERAGDRARPGAREGWLEDPPSDPIDGAVLSRDPAVGEAYAADPLVYHGGWKVPTLRGVHRRRRRDRRGPRLRRRCRCSTCTAVTTSSCRPGSPSPWWSGSRATTQELVVIDGARHEVFNETDQAETIGRVADFAERVT